MRTTRRAALFLESREPRISDWDLRQSILHAGQLNPLIYYGQQLLDGQRRLDTMLALHMSPRRAVLTDRIEAARTLWRVHPRRAYLLFADPDASPRSLAALFGCLPAHIPTTQQGRDYKRNRSPKATPKAARMPGLTVPREVYDAARTNCHQRGVSLSSMIRYHIYLLAGVEAPHPMKARDDETKNHNVRYHRVKRAADS